MHDTYLDRLPDPSHAHRYWLSDTPLLQLGPLEFGTRCLAGYPGLRRHSRDALSWLMTNYWKTNFEASLGGFHAADYHLTRGPALADASRALKDCRTLVNEFFCYRSNDK